MHRALPILCLGLLSVLALTGCPDDEKNNTNNQPTPDMTKTDMTDDMSGDMPGDMEDMPSDMKEALNIPSGCNPVAYKLDCMLPYPSDFFLVDDATMPSGKRVALPPRAQPTVRSGDPFDPYEIHSADGFSQHMPILMHFPKSVDTSNVIFHTDDPAPTLTAQSSTLLIDADSKALVAHWAEVDKGAQKVEQQVFIVRPHRALKPGTRYIVAFQNLKDTDKNPIEAPDGFRHLRDKISDPALDGISKHYEDNIFPIVTELGIERKNLQIAWDFTTKTKAFNFRDITVIRDEVIKKFEATPPTVKITKTVEDPSEQIALRLEGTITVPLFLENDKPGAKITRDEQGKIKQNGETEVPFTLQVPKSAIPESANFEPARILQYGHGFFGAREEINYGSFMRGFTDERKFIAAAVDWWGMDESDFDGVLGQLSDPAKVFQFTDRLHQAMANQIALTYALKGPIAQLPELQRSNKPLYDVDKLYYYGISQGHIFGGTFVALSPQITRAVFSVGGASYSFMMSRSRNFAPFLFVLNRTFNNRVTLQKFIATSQNAFDPVDPISYTDTLLGGGWTGAPEKRQILMQVGLGDAQVNNLASYLHARSVGLPLLTPSPVDNLYGFTTEAGPVDSALVLASFGIDPLPGIDAINPEQETPAHEGVRHSKALRDQLDAFLQPNGTITHTCDGVCDPE